MIRFAFLKLLRKKFTFCRLAPAWDWGWDWEGEGLRLGAAQAKGSRARGKEGVWMPCRDPKGNLLHGVLGLAHRVLGAVHRVLGLVHRVLFQHFFDLFLDLNFFLSVGARNFPKCPDPHKNQ